MKTTYGQKISALQLGQSAVLEKIAAGGSLEARKLSTGPVMFYWRRTREGKTERTPIGHYDSSAPPKSLQPRARGYSVAAALEAARGLAKGDAETPGGLRAERVRQAAASAAAAAAEAAKQQFTLRALCADYVAWLRRQEKESAADVENIFKNHLLEAFPAVAAKPASEVDKREIVAAVRRLTEAGKQTTARKLRSYLRAAYSCAVKADSDAALPASFIGYGVTVNPVESTAAIKGTSDKNPLPLPDLRKYWKGLQDELGVIGAALRLHVLTGGQRSAQLAKLTRTDLSADGLRLFDRKGKRTEPRVHLVPMTKQIRAELAQLADGPYLLSTDGGKTPMHSTSMSAWAQAVATRAGIKDFQLKRVRSGIETALAAARIPLHIRGQLQSHGIGGVQEKHYDAHHYLPEKRQALEALQNLLKAKPASNVRPSSRKAG